MSQRVVSTYPLGPYQPSGNELWVQDSVFQPWAQNAPDAPFHGMAMYGGFVEARYAERIPSYQPGMPTNTQYGKHLAMYSGFVNEHSLEGI
jgi:hypothetical protein